jgi:hypothetical protein
MNLEPMDRSAKFQPKYATKLLAFGPPFLSSSTRKQVEIGDLIRVKITVMVDLHIRPIANSIHRCFFSFGCSPLKTAF